ncbi:MAG: TonB-dependent receptor [Xanthomonadales bacterium]|jgi:outer membrane receptor protein involved in Fe transport|nr:TonB-dependent receptor [Xanthomonadales bacterium]
MRSSHLIKRNALSAAITAALLASLQTTVLMAQDQVDEGVEADAMEEIIVTATRRESTIVDIPYNISAVSGNFIDSGKIMSTSELLRGVPGANVIDYGARNSGNVNTIRIRGLAIDSSINVDIALSAVPPVSTYLNDTPVYANMILKDLERVEVLRGPQGTLYGSGSLGGTVRYITRRPLLELFEGRVEGSFSQTSGSSGNNWDVDLMLNIPMGETVAARIVAGTIDYAGIMDLPNAYVLDGQGFPVAPDGILAETAEYEYLKDVDTVEIDYIRASLLWQPNDKFNALLTWSHQEDEVGGRMMPTNGNDGWGDPYGNYETGSIQREPSSREVDVVSLEMSYDFGFATLTSSTSGYDHSGDSTSENTGFSAQQGWLSFYYGNYPRPMHSAERSYSDEAFIQELRLVSNTEGMFDWIAGAFYRDQDTRSSQVNYLRNFYNWAWTAWGCCAIGDDDFRYNREENFTDTAVFGELTWNVTGTFRMTGGFRYFDLDYDNDTFMGVGLWDTFAVNEQIQFSGSDSDTLFKFNASWDLNDNAMLYGTISEGFRRGGTNAVPLSGLFAEDPAWLRYGPDTTTNYEIGYKGAGNGSFYNISLFYVDWQDIQLNTTTTNWAFYAAQNGSSATTQGIELEYNKSFGKGWRLALGYAYTTGELDSVMWSADDVYIVAPKGNTLPGLAEHTANVMLENAFGMSNGWLWINRISGYYQSETNNSISETSAALSATMGSFSIWDFNSNLAINNRWTVGLFVKNMFNEEGLVGIYKEEYMGTSPEQHYYGNGGKNIIARPRTVGVLATWNF